MKTPAPVGLVLVLALLACKRTDPDVEKLCAKEMKTLGAKSGWASEGACAKAYSTLKKDKPDQFDCVDTCQERFGDEGEVDEQVACRTRCANYQKSDEDDATKEAKRLKIINDCNLESCTTDRGTPAHQSCMDDCCRRAGLYKSCKN